MDKARTDEPTGCSTCRGPRQARRRVCLHHNARANIERSCGQAGSSKGMIDPMLSVRKMVTSMLLLAMVMALPPQDSGHFVCRLGMAEAGPACSLCHGHAISRGAGPEVGNGCCTYISGRPVAESTFAPAPIAKTELTRGTLLAIHAGTTPAVELGQSSLATGFSEPPSRKPSPAYLSNFLRL